MWGIGIKGLLALTPFGALAGPIISSVGAVAGEIIKAFGRGLAATFANPAVLLIILASAGSAYVYAFGTQGVKIKKAERAVITMRDQMTAQCPPSIASRIRRQAGVKPKPEPSIKDWFPPGLNPF